MCAVLEVSSAGYYAWRDRPASVRATSDSALLAAIRQVHQDSSGRYGSPRVHAVPRRQGRGASCGRIERMMRRHGMVATAALTPVGPTIHRHFTDDARISRTNAKHGCVDYRSNYSVDWGASSNFGHTPPGHLTFGLRSSCERAELMLALVTRVTPVSTLADTFSPFEAASAVLTPS